MDCIYDDIAGVIHTRCSEQVRITVIEYARSCGKEWGLLALIETSLSRSRFRCSTWGRQDRQLWQFSTLHVRWNLSPFIGLHIADIYVWQDSQSKSLHGPDSSARTLVTHAVVVAPAEPTIFAVGSAAFMRR